MVNANRDESSRILNKTAQVRKTQLVKTGYEAALKTIDLDAFRRLASCHRRTCSDPISVSAENEKPADVLVGASSAEDDQRHAKWHPFF